MKLIARTSARPGLAYAIGVIALLAGLIVLPAIVKMSDPKVVKHWDAWVRQATLAGSLTSLVCLTAGLGLSMRGDPFGVLLAGRNRYSLSRLQMALWSWLILGGVTAAAASRSWGLGGANAGDALLVTLDPNLLAVMGISYFTGTMTPGLLALKSAGPNRELAPSSYGRDQSPVGISGQLIYRPAAFEARLIDLVDSDEASNRGSIDLSKLQQLVITLILIAVYAIMLFRLFGGDGFVIRTGPNSGFTSLPTLSNNLVELLLISHAGYLGYNAVSKPVAAPSQNYRDGGPPPTPARIDEP